MTATLEDPAAPVRNKPRSGGPKTQAGKDAARRNALKHGMRAEVVFPEDLAEVIAERTGQFRVQFQPVGPYEEWLVRQIAVNSALVDRCEEVSIAEFHRMAYRASTCWDEDCALAVAELASKLSKDPARIVAGLRTSKHGVAWLIERWNALGEALRRSGTWDDAHWSLAFDLLGTPESLRTCSLTLPLDADLAELTALVADQLDQLDQALSGPLDALDQANRELAEVGIPLVDDAQTRQRHRYESRCQNALRWALNEFRAVHIARQPKFPIERFSPELNQEPEPNSEPKPEPEPDQESETVESRGPLKSRLSEALAKLAVASVPTDAPSGPPETAAVPSSSSSSSPAPTRCRRARKALEKQARARAKRAARAQ